jgi:hypothetical protein
MLKILRDSKAARVCLLISIAATIATAVIWQKLPSAAALLFLAALAFICIALARGEGTPIKQYLPRLLRILGGSVLVGALAAVAVIALTLLWR